MLAVGNDFTVVCLADGTVRAWGGSNEYGQLTIPADIGTVKYLSAGNGFVVATRTDGTVISWGRNDAGQLNSPVGLEGVSYTVSGSTLTYAVKEDGTLVCWGCNGYIPEDVQTKGVRHMAILETFVAIETFQGSITTFDGQ